MTREIEKLRVEIDSIDREMIKLFEARMDVSREVGAYKRERGLPVYDAARERQVILSRIDQVKEPEYREYAEMLMRAIMDYSKKIQRSAPLPCRPEVAGRIAYQGAPGAYGQEAARRYFPRGELIAQSSFEDVFGAVSAGQVEYGVVPVENSVAGSVAENWDLLGRYGLFVVGEIILKIDHVLLGTQDSDLAHIKKVYSHPQALSQCNGFFIPE